MAASVFEQAPAQVPIKSLVEFNRLLANEALADGEHDFDAVFKNFMKDPANPANPANYFNALPFRPSANWKEKDCMFYIGAPTSEIRPGQSGEIVIGEYNRYYTEVVKVTPEDLFTNTPDTGANTPDTERGKIESGSVLVVDFAQHHFFEKIKENTWNSGPPPTIYYAMVPEVLNDPALKTNLYNKEFKKDTGINVIPILDNKQELQEYIPPENLDFNYKKDLFFSKYTFQLDPIQTKQNSRGKYEKLYGKIQVTDPSDNILTFANTTKVNQNSISKIMDRIKNFFGNRDPKSVFETICGFQRKRAGDWLQVLACFDIHNRSFINVKKKDGKIYDNNPINMENLGKVYFVTHDQIACAYALLMGANVMFYAPPTYYADKAHEKTHVMIFKNQGLLNESYVGGKQSVPVPVPRLLKQSGGKQNDAWLIGEFIKALNNDNIVGMLFFLTKLNNLNDDIYDDEVNFKLFEIFNDEIVNPDYYNRDDFFNLLNIFSGYINLDYDFIFFFFQKLITNNYFLYYILSSFITYTPPQGDPVPEDGIAIIDAIHLPQILNSDNLELHHLLNCLFQGLQSQIILNNFNLKKKIEERQIRIKSLRATPEREDLLKELEISRINVQENIDEKINIIYPLLNTFTFELSQDPTLIFHQIYLIIKIHLNEIYTCGMVDYSNDDTDDVLKGGEKRKLEPDSSYPNKKKGRTTPSSDEDDVYDDYVDVYNEDDEEDVEEDEEPMESTRDDPTMELLPEYEGFNIDKKNITREDVIYIQFLLNIKTKIHAGMKFKKLNNIKNVLLYSHFFYDDEFKKDDDDEFKDDENAAIILLNSANMEEAVGGRIIFPKKEDGSDIFTYEDAKSVITGFKPNPDTIPSYTIGELGKMVEEIGFSFFSKDKSTVNMEMTQTPVNSQLYPKNRLGSLSLPKRTSYIRLPMSTSMRTAGGGSKKRKYTKKHKKIRKHKHTRKHKPHKKKKHTRKNKTHKKTKHTRKNKQMSRRR